MNETDIIAPASHPYRAVCFDLDGTLLPMDLDAFLSSYYQALGKFAAERGFNSAAVLRGVDAGVRAMLAHDDGTTNHAAFWTAFRNAVDGETGDTDTDWEGIFNQFYEEDFGKLGASTVPNPAADSAVATLLAKGYPLVLTTMPLFPPRAVEWRLRWAGVDSAAFRRMTVYTNSTSVKPKLAYYQENLDALGLAGEEVLMVGNNTVEDLAFMQLGADGVLVTDCLLNPNEMDVNEVRHGTLEQFAQWVETLPTCKNPATSIQP